MLRLGLAFAATLMIGAAPAPSAGALDWLAGHWVSNDGDRWTEEHWLPARGGELVGINRSGRGDRMAAFEFMRIAPDDKGQLVFHASPAGTGAVAFRLTSMTPAAVTFENPTHDFPTVIRYRRQDNRLHAEIAGPEGAGVRRWTFRRH
jgi:hypothetical protein